MITHPILSQRRIAWRLSKGTLRVTDGVVESRCTGPCDQWLPADADNFRVIKRDGLTSQCRACLKIYDTRRRLDRLGQPIERPASDCPPLCRHWQRIGKPRCSRGHCVHMARAVA